MKCFNALASAAAIACGSLFTVGAQAAPTIVECPAFSMPTLGTGASAPALRDLGAANHIMIGSAVRFPDVLLPGPYVDIADREFSVITPENEMKWGTVRPSEDTYDFCEADFIVKMAQDHGMKVHGHNLVWGTSLPSWLTTKYTLANFNNNPTLLRNALIPVMQEHIATVIKHFHDKFPGVVYQWDVVNEAVADCAGSDACELKDNFWKTNIGCDYLALAFQAARTADPSAKLIYNDYGVEHNLQADIAKRNGILNKIAELNSDQNHKLVDGVGYQFHIGQSWPDVTFYTTLFQETAALGVEVLVTELDQAVNVNAPMALTEKKAGLQAGLYKEVMDACILEPKCSTFIVWGFSDAASSSTPDQANIYGSTFQTKLAYVALRNRLLEVTPLQAGEINARPAKGMLLNGAMQNPLSNPLLVNAVRLDRNGDYVSDDFGVAGSADYAVTVVARGIQDSGTWPTLQVNVDGALLGYITANSASFKPYSLPLSALVGSHNVRVTLINNFSSNRDAEISSVSIGTAKLDAARAYNSGGYPVPGGWKLSSNGYIENSVSVDSASGLYAVNFTAKGDSALGLWPLATVSVDGVPLGTAYVNSANWTNYSVSVPLLQGTHNIRIAITNNVTALGLTSNLYVSQFSVIAANSGLDAAQLLGN